MLFASLVTLFYLFWFHLPCWRFSSNVWWSLLSVPFLHRDTKKPVETYVPRVWGVIIGENSCAVVAWWASGSKRHLPILQMLVFGSWSYLRENHHFAFLGRGWWEKWVISLHQFLERPTTQLAELMQDTCFLPCINPSSLSGGSKPFIFAESGGSHVTEILPSAL